MRGLIFFGLLFAVVTSSALETRRPPRTGREFVAASAGEVLRRICEKPFSGRPFQYESVFAGSFRQKISETQFRAVLAGILDAAGTCATAEIVPNSMSSSPSDDPAIFEGMMKTNRQNLIHAHFRFDDDGFVTGLQVFDIEFPSVVIRTWNDVARVFAQLPGLTSLSAGPFGRPPVNIRGGDIQPTGSTFKLWVLKALEDDVYQGRRSWNDRYPIRNEWKSLPSGEMQDLPAGTMVSLGDYAASMIKISDNTAADHLLRILGREEVEQALLDTKHSRPDLNRPFMTTAEMFKLKWGAPVDWARRYVGLSEEDKRSVLDRDVFNLPLSSVGHNGLSMSNPTWIRQIEWFASAGDVCQVMESFVARRDPVTLKVLSQNTPFIRANSSGSNWAYAGYKGGSEPGVIMASYLLQDKRGRWGCLTMGWSYENRPINEWAFLDIVRKSLKVYETAF